MKNWVIDGVIKVMKQKAKEMDNNSFALYYSKVILLNNRKILEQILKSINMKPLDNIDKIYLTLKK